MYTHLTSQARSLSIKPIKSKPTIPIFIAGIGTVGNTLLQLIQSLDHPRYQLEVIGYCNSRSTYWRSPDSTFKESKTDWRKISNRLTDSSPEHLIFVDATGSLQVAKCFEHLLKHNIHIATPSKIANTLSQRYFSTLKEISENHRVSYKYETAVGAGLPIIQTVENLIGSGDKIHSIKGVLSGTLTYVFNQLNKGKDFSEVIRSAHGLGYTEPDPRDDLSGEDVARKFLILARTSGFAIERTDIEVENLVPEYLRTVSKESFFNSIENENTVWKNRIEQSKVQNKRLCYIGKFDGSSIRVGIEAVSENSSFALLKGTDNLIEIHTERYNETPIIVQGPGAGKEVTAAGILADILQIAAEVT
jgi:aspartokinase/homoserine dehydrogenase 1